MFLFLLVWSFGFTPFFKVGSGFHCAKNKYLYNEYDYADKPILLLAITPHHSHCSISLLKTPHLPRIITFILD